MIRFSYLNNRFLVLCCILIQAFSYAQKNAERDSLLQIVNTAPEDTNKANALVALASNLVQYQIKDAEKYSNQAIALAQKIDFKKAEAKAHLVLSRISRETSNYSDALNETYIALKIFERDNNTSGRAKCYYELGYVYKDITDYKKALDNFTSALQLYQKEKNETNIAFCQTLLGHVNADLLTSTKDTSYFTKALGYYTSVLNYYLQINKRDRVAVALLNLSNLYLVNNRIRKSEASLEKSLECSKKSFYITTASNDVLRTGINLENMGEVFFERKNYKSAIGYYLLAKQKLEESENQDYILENYSSIIKIYIQIGEYDRALDLANKYFDIAKKVNYKTSLNTYYLLVSEIYFAQNNSAKGLEARIMYENYKDSIFNEDKASALLKLQVEYETDQKDKEIDLLNKDKSFQGNQISQQQIIKNFLIASIILALLLLVLLYNRYRIKLKTNSIIEEKNKELEKLSIVARETGNGVFITDEKGNMEWFNEGFSLLFGWKTIEEYKATKGSNIFDVSANANINSIIKECEETHKTIVYENFTPDKAGNMLWVKTTLSPIFDEHGVLKKMVFVETDVTELKKAQETAEKSLHIQEQFLANTSHEIRTPMNGILGMTRQLLETPLNNEQAECVNAIKESSNNLLHVVNDILDISKIRAGKLVLEKNEFKVSDLFKHLQFLLQYKAEEKNIVLATRIDEKIPSVLLGDAFRLNQILINLAGNAIKFTEKGTVSFSAKLVTSQNNQSVVRFCVTDTGIGISENKLDYIFETFAQAETHTTRKYGGTGLGLSISKILVEELGGTIHVESKVGEGSSFMFDLLFDNGNPNWSGTHTTHTEGIPDHVNLSHLTILLVEDNIINQRVALFELKKWKVTSEVANNALQAIEKIKTKQYDLVLMDISMPDMDGIEATRFVRNNFPEPVCNIPIIAITASALQGEKERCIEGGMNDYISKPFNPVTLYKKIIEWTTNRNKQAMENDKKISTSEFKPTKLTDLTIILEHAEGDVTYIKEMIELYIESMPEYLTELQMHYQAKNWPDFEKQAHKMKTPVAYFGVTELKALFVKMEFITREADFENLLMTYMKRTEVLTRDSVMELKNELEKVYS